MTGAHPPAARPTSAHADQSAGRRAARVRVAVIGVGDFGARHARGLAALPTAELVAVADRDASRAEAVAAALDVPAHRDAATLLATARPDAVVVATSEAAHVEAAVDALEAGAAVLLEKPVSPDLTGALTLRDAVARTGGVLVPAHVLRFAAPYRQLWSAVHAGTLGDVVAVSARRDRSRLLSARYPSEHPARLTAVHDVDLALWVTGARPVRVRALARGRPGAAGPVLVQAQVETGDGGIWSIGSAYTHPDEDAAAVSDRFEVHGTASTLAVDSAGAQGDRVIGVDLAALLPVDGGGALTAQLEHFCACVAERRPSDVVTLEDAVVGLACVDAMIRSAAEGGRVVHVEVPT